MMNQTVSPKGREEGKEEENEYEELNLEQKMEAMGFWVQDSICEIHTILKRVIADYYEPDKEGKKTDLGLAMETIESNIGEIGLIVNTMEAH